MAQAPAVIRGDNDLGYLSETIQRWAKAPGFRRAFIQPRHPSPNAYNEREYRPVRYGWPAPVPFDTSEAVQKSTTRWLQAFDPEHPSMALGDIPLPRKWACAALLALPAPDLRHVSNDLPFPGNLSVTGF